MPDLREPLSAAELQFYGSIFQTLDPNNTGSVSGGVAKPLLEASGLPLTTLGEVWSIADTANTGYLDKQNFCIAMRLIGHAQNGVIINDSSKDHVSTLAKFGHIQPTPTGSSLNTTTATAPINSRVSSNSSTRITNPSLIVPLLSSGQASNFSTMFDKTAINGTLPGGQAKSIFMKARLPVSVLEQVWDLVDQNGNGQLTKPQFIVAMHLIQCFMNKSLTALPTVLSDQLWSVAENVSSSVSNSPINSNSPIQSQPPTQLKKQMSGQTNLNTWIMSEQQKNQYGAIFDTLDTKNQSFITSGTVANFLMTSKLPNQTLANIWELSNLDQSENFTKQEFSIAMYLVQKNLAGYELPEQTPIELINSSNLNNKNDVVISNIPIVPPQSFADAKDQAASQRSASHMDDLLGIFKTADQVAPSPPPPPPHHHYVSPPPPTAQAQYGSNFGREMQQKSATVGLTSHNDDEDSSDDDSPPENLDLPRLRGSATVAPEIPGRASKPHYDAIKNIDNHGNSASMFSSQPASGFSNAASTAGAGVAAGVGAGVGALAGAALGFTGSAISTAYSGGNNDHADIKAINGQITQASVDIANHSNEVNSLSKQTSIVSAKKEKAQNDLNRILKTKEGIVAKLSQLKALNEQESQQVIEVQNLMIKTKGESDNLENELRIVEANYHAEQTKKDQLQVQYDEAQKQSQLVKEQLGTLNAETSDLKQQIEEMTTKYNQINNLLAVTQQQVVTQEQENEDLKVTLSELNNSIFQVESKHQALLNKLDSLNDENLELNEKYTDLSIQSANKNVEYSQALADAASKGLAHDDDEESEEVHGEVPTAELDDDFDHVFGLTSVHEKQSEPSVGSEFTDKSTDGTSPTEVSSPSIGEGVAVGAVAGVGAFGLAHSETSSIQNNAAQSVRNDGGDEFVDSDASTIEESPLSSQILPEGQPEEKSAGDEDIDELKPADDAEFSGTIDDEFPAIVETQADDDDDDDSSVSSARESFEDAPKIDSNVELKEPETVKNPFSKDSTPLVEEVGDMFDDLGLEDAVVDTTDAFESEHHDNALGGFTFSGIEPAVGAGNDGDDWEQVFAGFGNDPSITNASVEPVDVTQPTITPTAPVVDNETPSHGGYSNAQNLAIDELSAMGFESDDIVAALEKNDWNIDDASNYLLDK